jgi:hypothetical protein
MRVPASFEKVYATEGQLREVKESVKELKSMLLEDNQRKSPIIVNRAEVMKEISKKEKFLAEFTPKKVSGKSANKLFSEAKKIEQEIKEAMPKQKKYFQRYAKDSDSHKKTLDFEQAVKQQMEFQTNRALQAKIHKYKSIMARLDPQDPTVRNIERLRPR